MFDVLNVIAFFGLSGFSYVAETPARSLILSALAAASAVRLASFMGSMPIKRASWARAYFLFCAVGGLVANVLRWTWLRR